MIPTLVTGVGLVTMRMILQRDDRVNFREGLSE